jgi:hypothetical protein
MKRSFLLLLLAGTRSSICSQDAPIYPDSRASDPKVLGWMQGTPPPTGKVIRFEDQSFFRFP